MTENKYNQPNSSCVPTNCFSSNEELEKNRFCDKINGTFMAKFNEVRYHEFLVVQKYYTKPSQLANNTLKFQHITDIFQKVCISTLDYKDFIWTDGAPLPMYIAGVQT